MDRTYSYKYIHNIKLKNPVRGYKNVMDGYDNVNFLNNR